MNENTAKQKEEMKAEHCEASAAGQPLLGRVFELYGKHGRKLGTIINIALAISVIFEAVNVKWVVAMYLIFEIADRVVFDETSKYYETINKILKYHNDAISEIKNKLKNLA